MEAFIEVVAAEREAPAAAQQTAAQQTAAQQTAAQETLTLRFDERLKTRARVRLDGGETVALHLPRGEALRNGDRIVARSGRTVRVVAAAEPVSTVTSRDAGALARIAYHLGNRHVAVEVGSDYVRYARDHVLDAMVAGLGHPPRAECAPFEPESGAYAGHHD